MMKQYVFNSSSFFLFIFVSWALLSRCFVVFSLNSEGEALLSLLNKFSFEADYSDKLDWKNLSSSSSTPCQWSGIGCNTEKTHVVSLDLTYRLISGQLGAQIGRLRYLKSVDLRGNDFNGSIPTELWESCSHLQHLDLSGNHFIGELPEAVRNLHQLKYFQISENQLGGRMPVSLFQISSLEFVDLSRNNLTGFIPYNIGNVTNMKVLDLSDNQLDGIIPTSISNCTKLETLYLFQNGLSGEIPVGVWRIPTLARIDVSSNNLLGQLPVEMTTGLHHLQQIDLSNNQFSGLIPEALGINNTALEKVDFSSNTFSGEIPTSLCLGTNLKTLKLRSNNFSGTIPMNFTSDRLYILDLNGNRFEGKIPRSLGILTPNILILDLGNNQLSDTFPLFLEKSSNLKLLVLRSNKLHGPLRRPQTLYAFNQLKILDISSNYFTGNFPLGFILGLDAMRYVDFNYYYDDDDISTIIIHKGKEMRLNSTLMTTFRAIDMSNNRIQGIVPESIGELLLLNMLNLSNNNLSSSIPSALGNLRQLESLDLSRNHLFGEIPHQLTNLLLLAALNVSHNNLTGLIPDAGGQFQTFTNASFEGNPGLCGYQLSRGCGDVVDTDKESYEDSNLLNIGWEPVVIGYGCGIVVGLVIQYFVFTKAFLHKWFG